MSWQRVKGHDALVESFDRAWQRGRLAHAYLFTGPLGVGKHLFARELAQALLCEQSPPGKLAACDHCPACLLVQAGNHPDLLHAGRPEDKHELPIDVMRELCRVLGLKPARGRGRIAIVDDADDLNEEAANCFLKTLEEPPPRSVLILIGTSADRQLPTIVSRCQVVRFAPLAEDFVAELLKAQGVEDEKFARKLARMSGGSPGQARALADPALWEFRRALLSGLAAPRVDSVALAKRFQQFVEEAGKESAAQRRRAALVVGLLIDFLNDAVTLHQGATPRSTEPDDLNLLQALVQRVECEQLLPMLERSLEAEMHIERRVQLVLILESLMDAIGKIAGRN